MISGIDPWYFYITEISKQLAPLTCIVFIGGLFLYWFKNKFDLISWLTLSTPIIFSIIGHKEIRYIPLFIYLHLFLYHIYWITLKMPTF